MDLCTSAQRSGARTGASCGIRLALSSFIARFSRRLGLERFICLLDRKNRFAFRAQPLVADARASSVEPQTGLERDALRRFSRTRWVLKTPLTSTHIYRKRLIRAVFHAVLA